MKGKQNMNQLQAVWRTKTMVQAVVGALLLLNAILFAVLLISFW